jgi:hypothetical protein
MSENNTDKVSPLFVQLILSFHAAAWQQLGKVASPLTGKIERHLDMAKNSIDILGMIEEKTRGNLADEEKKLLQHTLTELRMNYLDEQKKPAQPDEKEKNKADEEESAD